jgi:outer membrane protein TolC
MKLCCFALALLAGVLSSAGPVEAQISLTVEQARERALAFNRTFLSAQEEVVKAQGDIGIARSGALPSISLNSSYTRNFEIASAFFTVDGETQELQMGFENNFTAGVSVRQPLWEGGKVFTAYSVAKQYKQYAEAGAERVTSAVIYNNDLLFYSAIFAKAELAVLADALKSHEHNVGMVEKSYAQGQVSRFEVLLAKVELANLRPLILRAESNERLAGKRLMSYLGLDLDQPLELIEPQDDTSLVQSLSLSELIAQAIEQRPDLRQAGLEVDMRGKAVRIAQAGYFPSLEAVSAYTWQGQSDEFTLEKNNTRSFTAGLSLSWSIFEGGLTRSEVGRSKAELRQSELSRLDLIDRIRLDVEQAYDRLLQAKQSLNSQGETIAQAEEGLHIANVRYEAGEGTLLELLSAQTALSEARAVLAAALFSFRDARSNLKMATNRDI